MIITASGLALDVPVSRSSQIGIPYVAIFAFLTSTTATTAQETPAPQVDHSQHLTPRRRRLAVHAGRRRLRRVQPAGRPARRQGVRRAQLVDGHGHPEHLARSLHVHQHAQPRSGHARSKMAIEKSSRLAKRSTARRWSITSTRTISSCSLPGCWRIPLTGATGLTIAGGPVGEPALGPVAFMHRASAADNPLAALSHHTFDSTHIAFGVVTAACRSWPVGVRGVSFQRPRAG